MIQKPSFFDKLTGSISSNDENDITTHKDFADAKKNIKSPSKSSTHNEGQLVVDVYQTADEIIIKSTIAGIDPEDLDINIGNDMVTIKGKRHKEESIKMEDYFYQECYWGNFARSIILPVDIEPDKADASIKNGILTIKLPKIEKIKTKKLKVKSED
ncbi:MAG: hypothetical protein COU81_03105 [Candidatus Portnoybacteria bacterium CG10_big_fil_rev_8_21_14_0_10_36_7]|uniref:SHSP domain-containing protein n=1 Tax=Candidatus Portnoybacteria bacterium CG10_big_fil_rev_8_21_14_0_10_36_7 TaxID=1974812 RepID=A0A2M8KDK2_9BACT|nr:MAG: hypothetical protein COU81_03105 [Candidatus Portnoybacteria bacterium CG10_big_fil_rev_8_21_14_0_10_36_7]